MLGAHGNSGGCAKVCWCRDGETWERTGKRGTPLCELCQVVKGRDAGVCVDIDVEDMLRGPYVENNVAKAV